MKTEKPAGWIPIDKKLPNPTENVLVTVEHQQHRWVSIVWISRFGMAWHYADNGEKVPKEFKVIAWQPLAEPSKGE